MKCQCREALTRPKLGENNNLHYIVTCHIIIFSWAPISLLPKGSIFLFYLDQLPVLPSSSHLLHPTHDPTTTPSSSPRTARCGQLARATTSKDQGMQKRLPLFRGFSSTPPDELDIFWQRMRLGLLPVSPERWKHARDASHRCSAGKARIRHPIRDHQEG